MGVGVWTSSPPPCPLLCCVSAALGGWGGGRLSLILLDQMSLEVVQVRLSSVCPGVKEESTDACLRSAEYAPHCHSGREERGFFGHM